MKRRVIESGDVRVEIVKKNPSTTFEIYSEFNGKKTKHMTILDVVCAIQILKPLSNQFIQRRRAEILDAVERSMLHR